jgi:hypothetical protein
MLIGENMVPCGPAATNVGGLLSSTVQNVPIATTRARPKLRIAWVEGMKYIPIAVSSNQKAKLLSLDEPTMASVQREDFEERLRYA